MDKVELRQRTVRREGSNEGEEQAKKRRELRRIGAVRHGPDEHTRREQGLLLWILGSLALERR